MKPTTRSGRLSALEADRLRGIRAEIDRELPELIERYDRRMSVTEALPQILRDLRAVRDARGLLLDELEGLDDQQREIIRDLESGTEVDFTLLTLERYARSVGKRLIITMADT
jgi:hypothetical protein